MDATNTTPNHEPALRGEITELNLPTFGEPELGPALRNPERHAEWIAKTHAELGLRSDPEFLVELPLGSIIAFGAILNSEDRWIKGEDGWTQLGEETFESFSLTWDEETLLSYYPAAEGWRYLLETPRLPSRAEPRHFEKESPPWKSPRRPVAQPS